MATEKISDHGHGHLQIGDEGGASLTFRPLGAWFDYPCEAQDLRVSDAIRLLRHAGYKITPPETLNVSQPWTDETPIPGTEDNA